MAWNIGDKGFEMVLGTYVPHIIDDHIVGALEPLLNQDPTSRTRTPRSRTGASTPAAAPSWTGCSTGSNSMTRNWLRPAGCCATTGTCPAPP